MTLSVSPTEPVPPDGSLAASNADRTGEPAPQVDIRELDDPTAASWGVEEVGGKAASLGAARAAGLPVLPGFVVTTTIAAAAADPENPAHAVSRTALDTAVDRLTSLLLPGASLVVRSSSPTEDSAISSQAGRFRSVLDVAPGDVPDALANVVDSAAGAPMAVLVQPQVQARAGGVLFGVDPIGTHRDALILSAIPDTPADLVSGVVDGVTVPLTRRGRPLGPHPDWLPADLLRSLAALARKTARLFGGPQDMEWAVDDTGVLRLLQSRPVTTTPTHARPPRGAHILGPGPVAETFPNPLTPLEQDLWVPPLAEGIAAALRIAGGVSRRQLTRTPPIRVVADRVVADLELLGIVHRHRGWSKLDPRPGLRRLTVSWRVGRLRVALPGIAAEAIATLDDLLAAVPPLADLDDQQLLAGLERGRQALTTAHGYEVLVGANSAPINTAEGPAGVEPGGAAGAALRILADLRDPAPHGLGSGAADSSVARLMGDHPVLLALAPPSIPPRVPLAGLDRLAPAETRRPPGTGDDPHPGAADPQLLREALRLRARWLQELTAAIAMELGRRLAARGRLDDPADVTGLRLDQLTDLISGPRTPAIRPTTGGQPAAPGRPLPTAFRLSPDGQVIATHLGPVRPDRTQPNSLSGVPAGGGIGAGSVYQGDDPDDGAVLVVNALHPQLAIQLPRLAALVSTTGSPLSHLAILAREFGVPIVVGIPNARETLPTGTHVVVDGTSGRIDIVPDSPKSLAHQPEPVRERPHGSGPTRQGKANPERKAS